MAEAMVAGVIESLQVTHILSDPAEEGVAGLRVAKAGIRLLPVLLTMVRKDSMHLRPFRAFLSRLLLFALVSMLPPHAAMAMAPDLQGTSQQLYVAHGQMQTMENGSSQHAVSHSAQHGQENHQCHCGVHCGMCGACYSHFAVSAEPVSGFIKAFIFPAGPLLLNLAEIWLPIDPRPPRA